jgi:hypothetical protein
MPPVSCDTSNFEKCWGWGWCYKVIVWNGAINTERGCEGNWWVWTFMMPAVEVEMMPSSWTDEIGEIGARTNLKEDNIVKKVGIQRGCRHSGSKEWQSSWWRFLTAHKLQISEKETSKKSTDVHTECYIDVKPGANPSY